MALPIKQCIAFNTYQRLTGSPSYLYGDKQTLTGIIVVFVIAAVISGNPRFVGPLTFWIPLAVWIYLVWMVRKKKTNLFRDQMEPKLAERPLKRLKAFLRVTGISFAMYWVAFILQVVLVVIFDQPEEEGPVVFFIAFISVGVFVIATIGGLVIFLKGRRKNNMKEIPQ